MKPSDALRKGMTLNLPHISGYYAWEGPRKDGDPADQLYCCPIMTMVQGAILDGFRPYDRFDDPIEFARAQLRGAVVMTEIAEKICPDLFFNASPESEESLYNLIISLVDHEGWSRESILSMLVAMGE